MSTLTLNDAGSTLYAGNAAGSRRALWTGWGLSAAAGLFLAFDCLGKLLRLEPVVAGTVQLGYPADSVLGIGILLTLCLVAYVVPRFSVLGAVLLMGYLGGAIASQVRISAPLVSHQLFPVYVAILVWGGLFLREPRLRALFPWRVRG